MVPETKKYALLPILAILGILIYSNTFNAPFVLDDASYIVDNPAIRELKNFLYPSGTRYIAFLSFALNYAAGGYDTFGYHITNVLIHISNGFFVYLLVHLLFKTPLMKGARDFDGALAWGPALFTSLIFLSHPIQTQAVTYTTQRFATLATFFYLLSVLLYLKARLTGLEESSGSSANIKHWCFYLGALFSGIIAQKTKEISFTLPATIALTEFAFFDNQTAKGRRFVRLIPFVLLFTIIPLSLFGPALGPEGPPGIAKRVLALQLNELATLSSYEYFITELKVVVTYLRLLVFPVNQNLIYDYPVSRSIFDPQALFSFIFLSVLFFSGIYLFIRSKTRVQSPYLLLVSFGIIWLFITLSIESSIIPIKDVIFEHRVYLPSMGGILVFTGLFFFILEKAKNRFQAGSINLIALSVIFIIVAVFSFAAHQRNTVWKDALTLWSDTVKKSPEAALPHYNLGHKYAERGATDRAIEEFRRAVKIAPRYDDAFYNLGVMYERKGLFKEAMTKYRETIRINPASADARLNLGILYMKTGRMDAAALEFQKAILIDKDLHAARAYLEKLSGEKR